MTCAGRCDYRCAQTGEWLSCTTKLRLALREEQRLRMLENRVLRRMYVP